MKTFLSNLSGNLVSLAGIIGGIYLYINGYKPFGIIVVIFGFGSAVYYPSYKKVIKKEDNKKE